MPARRLYASRGVPRRITTRRAAGSTRSFTGALALIAMLLAGGGGLLWLFNPWAPKPPPPVAAQLAAASGEQHGDERDRKSTRLNSSHMSISYAVFCLKKKKKKKKKKINKNKKKKKKRTVNVSK